MERLPGSPAVPGVPEALVSPEDHEDQARLRREVRERLLGREAQDALARRDVQEFLARLADREARVRRVGREDHGSQSRSSR